MRISDFNLQKAVAVSLAFVSAGCGGADRAQKTADTAPPMNVSAAPDTGNGELPPEPLPGSAPSDSGAMPTPTVTGQPLAELDPEWQSHSADALQAEAQAAAVRQHQVEAEAAALRQRQALVEQRLSALQAERAQSDRVAAAAEPADYTEALLAEAEALRQRQALVEQRLRALQAARSQSEPLAAGAESAESTMTAAAAEDAEPAKSAPRSTPRTSPSGSGGGGFLGGGSLASPPMTPLPMTPLPTSLPPNLPQATDLPVVPDLPAIPQPDAAVPAVPRINPASPQAATSVGHVDAIVEQLPYGEIVYNAPQTMQFGQPTDIELLLSPTESAESLRSQLQDPTNAVSSNVQIDSRMEAKLSGTGFAIEALTPSLQAVTSARPTRWRWRVTPTDHGPQELHLSLLAHIDLPGNDAPLVVETKDALIQVEITMAQRLAGFVEPNWQWLWGAVVFPIVGYRWRRQRHQSDRDESRRAAA